MYELDERKSERLKEIIRDVNCENYNLSFGELITIYEFCKSKPFECICAAYKYGFVRGQRAEKARRRRKGTEKKITAPDGNPETVTGGINQI